MRLDAKECEGPPRETFRRCDILRALIGDLDEQTLSTKQGSTKRRFDGFLMPRCSSIATADRCDDKQIDDESHVRRVPKNRGTRIDRFPGTDGPPSTYQFRSRVHMYAHKSSRKIPQRLPMRPCKTWHDDTKALNKRRQER